jgi:hypothetical protein
MLAIQQAISDNPNASDAEIVAIIEASRAYRRVPIEEVRTFVLENLLTGRLALARDNASTPIEMRAFLGEFLTGLGIAQSLDATKPQIAAAIGQAVPAMVAAGVMSAEEAAAFNAMISDPPAPSVEVVAHARAMQPHLAHADELNRRLDIGRHGNRLAIQQYLEAAESDPTIAPLDAGALTLLGDLPE